MTAFVIEYHSFINSHSLLYCKTFFDFGWSIHDFIGFLHFMSLSIIFCLCVPHHRLFFELSSGKDSFLWQTQGSPSGFGIWAIATSLWTSQTFIFHFFDKLIRVYHFLWIIFFRIFVLHFHILSIVPLLEILYNHSYHTMSLNISIIFWI